MGANTGDCVRVKKLFARGRGATLPRVRYVLALIAIPALAHAEVGVGASVGAGAQGEATYGAVDLVLTATWPGVRVGLGARGVWDDGVFRRSDWASAADAVTVVRDVEASYGPVALAAGRLAPAHVGRLADGYRATLDDRWRTGARVAATTDDVQAEAEIDDVLDPALVAGAVRWQVAAPYAVHAAVATDPGHATAIEAGAARRWQGDHAQLDTGGSIVVEPSLGISGVVFGEGAIERAGVRWTARTDVRAGTGSVGALFGPLYRVERVHDRFARPGAGVGAGVAIGAVAEQGFFELAARERPGLGGEVSIGGGAPMGRYVQAGVWAAASRTDAAGAAELRVAWAKQLFSAVQAARFYRFDAMAAAPEWSLTTWFGYFR
jgi:hypothetical protein